MSMTSISLKASAPITLLFGLLCVILQAKAQSSPGSASTSSSCCNTPALQSIPANLSLYRSHSTALQIFTNLKITCNGLLSSWSFLSTTSTVNGLHLSVWRLSAGPAGTTVYRLVCDTVVNDFAAEINAWNTYKQFIPYPVRAGDVIGIFYDDWVTSEPLATIPHVDRLVLLPSEQAAIPDFFQTKVSLLSAKDVLLIAKDKGVTFASAATEQRIPGIIATVGQEISKLALDQFNSKDYCRWPKFDAYTTNASLYRGQSTATQLLVGVPVPIQCSGYLLVWNFVSSTTRAKGLYLSVWRSVPLVDAARNKNFSQMYRVVAKVPIKNFTASYQSWNSFSQFTPFRVEAGDIIGIFYDDWTASLPVIPMTDPLQSFPTESQAMSYYETYVSLISAVHIENSDDIASFDIATRVRRVYAVQAVIWTAGGASVKSAIAEQWRASIGCSN